MSWRILAFLMVVATNGNALATHLRLLWSAPSNCPGTAQILAQIDELLGKSADAVLTSPLYVTATVKQEGEEQWSLDVLWHRAGAESSRRLQSDSCVDLARAAALTTALVIDPNAATSASASADSPTEAIARVQIAEAVPSASSAWRSFVSRPIGAVRLLNAKSRRGQEPFLPRASVSAAGVAEFGTLPNSAIGASLGLEFAWGRLSVRGELGTFLPQIWAEDRYAGTFWLTEASLGPCYSLGPNRFQVATCIGAVLQGYLARTNAGDGMASAAHWAGLMRGHVGVAVRYRPSAAIAMLGSACLMVGPDRPEFRLRPDTPVFAPQATAFRLSIGAAYDRL